MSQACDLQDGVGAKHFSQRFLKDRGPLPTYGRCETFKRIVLPASDRRPGGVDVRGSQWVRRRFVH